MLALRLRASARCLVLSVALSVALPYAAVAAGGTTLSCQLEGWLGAVEKRTRLAVAALGTTDQQAALAAFRVEMQRFPMQRIERQINASGLGTEAAPLMAYVQARNHLLGLQQAARDAEALRFATDPRLAEQGAALQSFLDANECDPDAPNYLTASAGPSESTLSEKLKDAAASLFYPDEAEEVRDGRHEGSGGEAGTTSQHGSAEGASQLLGVLVLLGASTAALWTRHRVVAARERRQPFVGLARLQSQSGVIEVETVDVSRAGMKVRCEGGLKLRSALRIQIGGFERNARVRWSNEHFSGLVYSTALTRAEFAEFLRLQDIPLDAALDVSQDIPADDRATGAPIATSAQDDPETENGAPVSQSAA